MQLSGWPAELPELLVKRDQRVLTFDHRDAGVSTHFGSAGGVSMGGIIAQIVAADYPVRVLFLTSMMATSVKPGLPIIAKPERFASVPPPTPHMEKQAYIERQIKVAQALVGTFEDRRARLKTIGVPIPSCRWRQVGI